MPSSYDGSLPSTPPQSSPKSIAIVGAGQAGIGALLALLDLPAEARREWDIQLYDRRHDIGGVWLPDPTPVPYPGIPQSPLYPLLRTNTPVPTMTYPGLPFAPGTPLYPQHEHIESYLSSVVDIKKLWPYIQLKTEVDSATFDSSSFQWNLALRSLDDGQRQSSRKFDHLIVANGHYAYPYTPKWDGTQDWLAGGDREIVHSLWYRGSETLGGRTVLVVGFSASGWDIARQALVYAKDVYHSYTPGDPGTPGALPPIVGTIQKPRISHFTASAIHFNDGTTLSTSVTTVFVCTGYDVLVPWLTQLTEGELDKSTARKLTTNGSYLTPLYQSIFSADASIPSNRLAIVGLPWFTAVAATAYAQGLLVAHALAQDNLLPDQDEMLDELERKEKEVREKGFEPNDIGHKFTAKGDAEAYQNRLIEFIRERSSVVLPPYLADPDRQFVEPWRVTWRGKGIALNAVWMAAVAAGVSDEDRFTSLTGTEEDWVRAMEELERWGIENTVEK